MQRLYIRRDEIEKKRFHVETLHATSLHRAQRNRKNHISYFLGEAHSSGTTEAAERREGDGADSPTRAGEAREAARPKPTYFDKLMLQKYNIYTIFCKLDIRVWQLFRLKE